MQAILLGKWFLPLFTGGAMALFYAIGQACEWFSVICGCWINCGG